MIRPASPSEPSLVLLLGATAVGKTGVACALQDQLGGPARVQLISVDSALVYRGMDVGTAKPDAAERRAHPHALIDIRDPADPYTVADFVTDADAAVQDALGSGRLPVLVGGTMLYAHRFLHGIAALPSASAEMRAALTAELAERGAQTLHAELARQDPEAAAHIHPQNSQRLLRALEVLRVTGQPLSGLWRSQAGEPATERLRCRIHVCAIMPDDRRALHERIALRLEAMLAAGFVEEVRALRARGDLHAALPAMRAVGYRQAWQHLDGELTHAQFVADAQTATRRLAKRQLTWLRRWPDLHTLSWGDAATVAAAIVRDIRG